MSNTDKLLRAFIEASGYEIEEVKGGFKKSQYGGTFTVDYKVTNKINKYKESYEKLKVTCLNAAKVKELG